MCKVEQKLKLAHQVCQHLDRRLTPKRERVLTILLPLTQAISAYELIDLYQAHFQETISPMSAYRFLDFLEEVNLVHKIKMTNKYIACAHIGEKHSHEFPQFLVCQQCQRVDELESNANNMSNLAEVARQAAKTGFKLASPQVELSCICNACL